jgi:hypothetical protein
VIFRRLYVAWEATQTAITIPLVLLPAGVIALILGENASRAFLNIGGDLVIRILGALMVIGGLLVLTGTLRGNALVEVLGLSVAALGAAMYGGGVIIGLGTFGLLAGIGYFGITLALLGRVFLILKAARVADTQWRLGARNDT